jgi:uncharacterized C2H2 Zn-finger protein
MAARRTTAEGGLFRCEFCGQMFRRGEELLRHGEIAHAGRPFPPRCEVCGETFEAPADVKAHHEGVHRSNRG